MTHKRLVLASGSRRRRALVEAFASPVELIAPVGRESSMRNEESPEEYVGRLSLAKAREVTKQTDHAVVLGADTAVVIEGHVLGKPTSAAEAKEMLGRLRGRRHRVVTGVAALDCESGLWLASTRSTDVTMRRYSNAEVDAYVASGEPFDKAGGYAVQDSTFDPVESLDGCYLNVVGLPLCEAVTLLARLGVDSRLRPDWVPPERCQECPLHREHEVHRP